MNMTRFPTGKVLVLATAISIIIGGAAAGIAVEERRASRAPVEQVAPRPIRLLTESAVVGEAIRQASNLSDAFIAIAEAVTPAVVRIQSERLPADPRASGWLPRGLNDFFGAPDSLSMGIPEVGGGTGFLISDDGYIVTNNHVIEGASRITVTLRDKRSFRARVVGRDPTTDLAVLKVDATDLPSIALGDSDQARVGEWVIAIGNPGFSDASTLDFTVTSGIISAKGRPLNIIAQGLAEDMLDASRYAIEDFIQTDAVINPGNSGGPLVNLRGAVIGVNTAIATSTGYNQGYGFAIPSKLATRVIRDLIERGHVRRALLGVQIAEVTPEDAEVYGLPTIHGVVVEDFADDSPARAAGLERHDVIVGLDGVAIERVGHLQRMVALNDPGEDIELDVVRFGRPMTFRVRLTQAPITESLPLPAPRAAAATPERLGIQIGELTPGLARDFGFSEARGIVVIDVTPMSAADRKRIQPGHRLLEIDRQPIGSLREARTLLRSLKSGAVASFLLELPEGRTYIANVRVP
jgi:serine protease Do